MRLSEILTERLAPKPEILASLKQGLLKAYNMRDSVDDLDPDDYPDDLALLLKYTTNKKMFSWSVMPEEQGKQVTEYIHSASVMDNGVIHFNIYPNKIEEQGLDWDRFIEEVMYIADHEAVHMSQRDKMTPEFWAGDERTSGYQKMEKYLNEIREKEGREPTEEEKKIGMKIYLGDPQEIMGHAINLAHEIKQSDDPNLVLSDPEGFVDYLSTWRKYRNVGFLRKDPVMRRLLKYTYQYMKNT